MKKIAEYVITLSFEIIDLKIKLTKLRELKTIYLLKPRRFSLMLPMINNEADDIRDEIEKLQSKIKWKLGKLFNGKLFGELKQIEEDKFIIERSSITAFPISYLSTEDINNGFVLLTEIIPKDNGKVSFNEMIYSISTGKLISKEEFERATLKQPKSLVTSN